MIQHQSGTEFEEAEEWEHMKTLNKTKEHADNVCAILRSSFHALPTHPVPTPIFFPSIEPPTYPTTPFPPSSTNYLRDFYNI